MFVLVGLPFLHQVTGSRKTRFFFLHLFLHIDTPPFMVSLSDCCFLFLFQQYLERYFLSNSEINDASIVLILLGGEDYLDKVTCEAEVPDLSKSVCQRLKILIEKLLNHNSNLLVSISGIPKPPEAHPLTRMLSDEITKNIQSMVESFPPSRVKMGPKLSQPVHNFLSSISFDGRHYSSTGYRNLAKQWLDLLQNDIVQIEWKYFKKLL
eukprot:Sdes_comp20087_c0_seq4m13034